MQCLQLASSELAAVVPFLSFHNHRTRLHSHHRTHVHSLTIGSSSADELFALLRSGQDSLTVDRVHARSGTLDGGIDSDTLNIIARHVTGVFSRQNFDRINVS